MPALLLIDTNVLGIGSMHQHRYRDLSHHGMASGAILGIVEKLAELVASHPGHVPIALWDDRCKWREALLPSYKRYRWVTPEQVAFLESYLRQVEIARELLRHLGVPQAICPGFEADDIVGVICRRADPTWLIKLATTDSDWLQALRSNVEWYSVATGRIVTHEDLVNPDRVAGGPFASVDHFIQAKALAGDPSDGIPGVVGVGIKTAATIIRDHGSVEALWAKHDAGDRIKGVILQRAAGHEYRAVYLRNLQMIDWRLAPVVGMDVQVDVGATDEAAASRVCNFWGIPAATVRSLQLSPDAVQPLVSSVREMLADRDDRDWTHASAHERLANCS
jgi:5'-3' exonuclease